MEKEPIQTDLQLDWGELFDNEIKAKSEQISIEDALILSINNYGRVDLRYICESSKSDYPTVLKTLKNSIYQNPATWNEDIYSGWETADDYLSGNLMQKYKLAKESNKKYGGQFMSNVSAINQVMPKAVTIDNIYIKLGTPWIPTSIIEDFIKYILDVRYSQFVLHDESIGTWEIADKSAVTAYSSRTRIYLTYGTQRIGALKLIEKILNNQNIVICDEVASNTNKSGKAMVINKKETLLALEKANSIKREFNQWLKRDKQRVCKLEKIYQEKFGCFRRRIFDGSFLTLPTMNKDITLYPYQKNAIARILFSPNTLLAHEVGAGKTYIMIASGMELKRMGISKKNMYVVPNNIVSQWESAFKILYPQAKIYVIAPNDFVPSKRQQVLKNIKDNEYDAIIMAYSSFEMIPLSRDYYFNVLKESIRRETERLISIKRPTNALKRKVERLKEKINKLALTPEKEQGPFFDELGINTLFVDEAHNFKNVPFDTNSTTILGVNATGSEKCKRFLDKVKYVQRQNNGRGIVFATGTPITNSISDIFVMQTYLQSGVLEYLDLSCFDAWVGNFAELASGFEIDVDTSNYRIVKRFTKFHNLQDLTSMLSLFADFYQTVGKGDIPKIDGYCDAVVKKSQDLSDYLKEISNRADAVRSNAIARTDDNMLKITTDGRKAALDIRLVNDKASFSLDSKVYKCAENVLSIYLSSSSVGGTQLVFCDSSTPKEMLNMYDELKRILHYMGINESEIEFIHNAKTEKQREKMFDAMRKSKIRVLIGSTWKLGLGVNVQDHLIALHHLDVPWRPADMVQREGRILRQGNLNKKVEIYRYITEGSFDAYSWQLLETKQRFINKLLAGSLEDNSGADIGDTVLKYAEVKALAIGNPLIKERVETANELFKLLTLKKNEDELKQSLLAEEEKLPEKIIEKQKEFSQCKIDRKYLEKNKREYSLEETRELGKILASEIKAGELLKEDKKIFEYNGFDILIPANMVSLIPYILIKGVGTYSLEMSISEIGVMIRLENFFNNFEKIEQERLSVIERFKDRLKNIRNELEKDNNYVEQINELQEKLENLDKQLGVTK